MATVATCTKPTEPRNAHTASYLPPKPVQDNYHMPAEWEPHERTWILWPTRPDVWVRSAQPAQKAFASVANAIARFEPVTVGVPPGSEVSARELLFDSDRITVAAIEQDDAWVRDTGPLFVVRERVGSGGGRRDHRHVRGVDWSFNAWGGHSGGCYSSWEKDDMVAGAILKLVDAERYKANMVLEVRSPRFHGTLKVLSERQGCVCRAKPSKRIAKYTSQGGSVHVDGEGTLLTTEECLFNPNRNPSLSKGDIETLLRDYLGVESVLWLGQGVVGDVDTDGHVDNLVAFVRPGEVVLHWTDDVADPQHAVSSDALRRLEGFTDARGRQLKVHKCPIPGPLCSSHDDVASLEINPESLQRASGERLAASYVNFYLANGAVILPGFGVPEDEVALRMFEALFPDREVVQVSTRDIALGGGNIHCITQQQPLGVTGPPCV